MSLPQGYSENIERVSNLVSFVFPFEGEAKNRYLDWLADNVPPKRKRGYAIDENEYLKEAQDVGTFVHLQMEHRIKGQPQDEEDSLYELHREEIVHGLNYISNLNKEGWEFLTEVYVRDNKDRYQGTVDIVMINHSTKKVKIIDWKTWGIAKKRYGLPNGNTKPYSKLKKVSLQLSLYAEVFRRDGYEIEGIYGVWLHATGAFEYALNIHSSEEIEGLLEAFKYKDQLCGIPALDIKITDMEIEVHCPTGLQFEFFAIKVDTRDDKRPYGEIIKDLADMKVVGTLEFINARKKINSILEEQNGDS